MNKDKEEENEACRREMADAPSDSEIRKMSKSDIHFAICQDSENCVKRRMFEEELERRLSEEQNKDNRTNMIIAAIIGGTFALIGTMIGAFISN
jgi:hypothetical protein